MDVVGPDVDVMILLIVETVDFVVNNVEKCWDELWLVIPLVLEMLKITKKVFHIMIYPGIVHENRLKNDRKKIWKSQSFACEQGNPKQDNWIEWKFPENYIGEIQGCLQFSFIIVEFSFHAEKKKFIVWRSENLFSCPKAGKQAVFQL